MAHLVCVCSVQRLPGVYMCGGGDTSYRPTQDDSSGWGAVDRGFSVCVFVQGWWWR
jgi:hypothetical protein